MSYFWLDSGLHWPWPPFSGWLPWLWGPYQDLEGVCAWSLELCTCSNKKEVYILKRCVTTITHSWVDLFKICDDFIWKKKTLKKMMSYSFQKDFHDPKASYVQSPLSDKWFDYRKCAKWLFLCWEILLSYSCITNYNLSYCLERAMTMACHPPYSAQRASLTSGTVPNSPPGIYFQIYVFIDYSDFGKMHLWSSFSNYILPSCFNRT